MKSTLGRITTGRLTYGQNYQNLEATNETDNDGSHQMAELESGDGRHSFHRINTSGVAAAPPTVTETNVVQPLSLGQPNQTWEARFSNRQLMMYKAAREGNWRDAERLLRQHPTLACDKITERGDKALHVAAAMKHKEFVQKLVERINPDDLASRDGHGYTACCYAAISGAVKIAEVMMAKYPNLATAKDKNGETPVHKAASRGEKTMVRFFLKYIKVDGFLEEEWFDLLRVAIQSKMFDVALEILKKNGSLATMTNQDGLTALHLLAREEIPIGNRIQPLFIIMFNRISHDFRLLAEKLWAELKEQSSVLELIRKPPILHEAAKVGNVKLITMLTDTYPDLLWDTDSNGYTIFHIAAIHRQDHVFELIHQVGAMKDIIATSQDEKGNNILHLAGKLAPLEKRKNSSYFPAIQMQEELIWFEKVEAIVPPSCRKMTNKERQTPRELFSMQHKALLAESKDWMKSTAESCMLIAAIMLTVVFAAAFTPPGGIHQDTGIPLLLTRTWFTLFIIFEGLSMFGSILSLIMFWPIQASSFEEDLFVELLPIYLKLGLFGMSTSLIGAVLAFMSTYFLAFEGKSGWYYTRNLAAYTYLAIVVSLCGLIIVLRAYASVRGTVWSFLTGVRSGRK